MLFFAICHHYGFFHCCRLSLSSSTTFLFRMRRTKTHVPRFSTGLPGRSGHTMMCQVFLIQTSTRSHWYLFGRLPSGATPCRVQPCIKSELSANKAYIRSHCSLASTIFSLSLCRDIDPFLLCFLTFSSFLFRDFISSPLISPAFLTVLGMCRCR